MTTQTRTWKMCKVQMIRLCGCTCWSVSYCPQANIWLRCFLIRCFGGCLMCKGNNYEWIIIYVSVLVTLAAFRFPINQSRFLFFFLQANSYKFTWIIRIILIFWCNYFLSISILSHTNRSLFKVLVRCVYYAFVKGDREILKTHKSVVVIMQLAVISFIV